LYAAAVQVRRRAFVEQGKLVLHLDSLKLPAGKSIYSMLQARHVPEGSVHQARMAADILKALVQPGLITEARFDEIITFRVARQGRRLIQGKAAITLTPENLASLMLTGDSASIGAELDCLCEHGTTIADREAQLEAKATEAAALKAAEEQAAAIKAAEDERIKKEQAAEIERLKAEAAANAANASASAGTEETEEQEESDPDEEEEEESDEDEESDPDEEEEESDEDEEADPDEEEESEEQEESDPTEETTTSPPVTSTAPPAPDNGNPPPPPPAPTAASITSRIETLLVEALELGPDEMEKLVHYLRRSTNDLAATLDAMKIEEAA
jgi:flagellar biosynthesis GTPase FlhF